MNNHFLGLEGAATIGTASFLATQQAIQDLVDKNAMGAFVGDAGLGKTFAVETARQSTVGVRSCRVVIPHRATMRRVAVTLLEALTGERHEAERFRLADDLVRILSDEPRLIVADEAQNANHDCIEFLRHIHDEPSTQFALALTGGNGCWQVLSKYPMLRSRIYRRVRFERMDLATVLQVIPSFHPIYAASEQQVIGRIDAEFGHGTFRDWAAFTADAVAACADNSIDTVDDFIVSEVLQRRRGQHAA
jgi:AAA domain